MRVIACAHTLATESTVILGTRRSGAMGMVSVTISSLSANR
jgi:hypothetical protein